MKQSWIQTSQKAADLRTAGWAVGALLLIASAIACGDSSGSGTNQPGGADPTTKSAVAATAGLAAKAPDGAIPKSILARVQGDALSRLRGVEESKRTWSTPKEMAAVYYIAVQQLARLGRAEGLATGTLISENVKNMVNSEYRQRLYDRMVATPQVTERDIKEYYDSHQPEFSKKGRFWIRHIFLNTVDNPGKEKEKESDAQKALAAIQAGTRFEEVAEKYCDVEQDKGAVIGPMPYGDINPDLEKKILALKSGETTGVIKSKWGYNVFQLEKNEAPSTESLDAVHDRIQARLKGQKMRLAQQQFNNSMDRLYPVAKQYQVLDAPETSDDAVVASSRFLTITVGDFKRRINRIAPNQRPNVDDAEFRSRFLDRWIERERIAAAASRMGIDSDPEMLALKRYLTDRTLVSLVLQNALANLSAPTDEEVAKYYEDNRARFVQLAQVRLRELAISYELPTGATRRDYFLESKKARDKMQAVLKQLGAGADFVELVKKHSTAPSAKKDGDLGFVVPEQRGKRLAEAVQNLAVGRWTPEPIEERQSFIIYRVEERKSKQPAPLDDVRKAGIRRFLQQQNRLNRGADILIELAKASSRNPSVQEIRKIVEGK